MKDVLTIIQDLRTTLIILHFSLSNFFCVFSFVCLFFSLANLVPQPGITPASSAVEVQSLNHWIIQKVPVFSFIKGIPVHWEIKNNMGVSGNLSTERLP